MIGEGGGREGKKGGRREEGGRREGLVPVVWSTISFQVFFFHDCSLTNIFLFISGFGQLKGQAGDKFHKTWALYFVKFIEAYATNKIKLWGITVENEPSAGFVPG